MENYEILRDKTIAIRFTEEEYNEIIEKAKESKRRKSDFCRYAIMTYIKIAKKAK